jgi:serine/threonine protein kinase
MDKYKDDLVSLLNDRYDRLIDPTDLVTGCLEAVNELHQHSIIHNDITPNNFLSNQALWRLCITDFGLAVNADDDGQVNLDKGTPLYWGWPRAARQMEQRSVFSDDYECLANTMYALYLGGEDHELPWTYVMPDEFMGTDSSWKERELALRKRLYETAPDEALKLTKPLRYAILRIGHLSRQMRPGDVLLSDVETRTESVETGTWQTGAKGGVYQMVNGRKVYKKRKH